MGAAAVVSRRKAARRDAPRPQTLKRPHPATPPLLASTAEAAKKHPTADVFVNYASFRRWASRVPGSSAREAREPATAPPGHLTAYPPGPDRPARRRRPKPPNPRPPPRPPQRL